MPTPRLLAHEIAHTWRRSTARPPAPVVAHVVLPLSAAGAWALVTDVRRHERWVPMTRIEAGADLGPGDVFTAVTGPTAPSGGPGLVDRMTVLRADSPGERTTGVAEYRKDGPVLRGGAGIEVRPLGAAWCEVTWIEQIGVRGLPTVLTDPVSRIASRLMLEVVLRRVRADVRASPAASPRGHATNRHEGP
ncbi:SRPBCC family protein [Actinotalea sp.]|uniref:SRPBCC family protein n=1 Tax=Actinotalea sp. TaxID=1872145 RepID=UPI003566CA4E